MLFIRLQYLRRHYLRSNTLAKAISLADTCIYTIISPDKLLRAAREHKSLFEKKRWVGAVRYLKKARVEGLELPIVFADARECTKLIAWSTLDNLVVDGSTKFRVRQLYDIGIATRSNLTVLSTGKPIPADHVRPYVICKTPRVLASLAQRPVRLLESKISLNELVARDYWIIKGRPSENDFEEWLKPGAHHRWRTGRPPKKWAKGDRLFFWRMSPKLDIVGLGEFVGISPSVTSRGETVFTVKYLGPLLSSPVGVEELRRDRLLGSASFLKRGPAGTVFPLTSRQGERLYQLICRTNSFARDVWPDLRKGGGSGDVPLDVDMMEISATEGQRRLVSHLRLERDRRIIETKKSAVLHAKGALACEVCHFDFVET